MLRRYRMPLLVGTALWLGWLSLRPSQSPAAKLEAAPQLVFPAPAATSLTTGSLPSVLERAALEPARRDPFAPAAPPPLATVVQQPVPSIPPVAAPPPQAPPLNLRFAGRTTSPDGRQALYVNYGETSMVLTVGQTLPNGYRVDAITAHAVELSYPPLNSTAQLELPAPPRQEIR